jgi:hypothetical protein
MLKCGKTMQFGGVETMNRKATIVSLLSLLAICWISSGALAGDEGEAVTVAGMLVGIEEDADGNYTRVFLKDGRLGNILIANDENGSELVARAGSQVEVSGNLVDKMDGEYDMVLYVSSWSPLTDNTP